MNCIYCNDPTAPSSAEAVHAFPEAIIQNKRLLPAGSVCGRCNNYFANHLDPAIVAYPWIAFCIQMLELPGKKGRKRRKIAGVKRCEDGSITIDVDPGSVELAPGGQLANVNVEPGPLFDAGEFRRALHYLAFNSLILARDLNYAFEPRFQPVRTYIRRPQKGEAWPIAQTVATPLTRIRPQVGAREVVEAPGETTCVRLFNCDFYVDLLRSQEFPTWARARFGQDAVLDVDWRPRPRTRPRDRAGRHRLRVHPPKE